MAARRSARRATLLLEAGVGRAREAGDADRLREACDGRASRRVAGVGDGGGVGREGEASEQARGGDCVYDAAGGVGGVAITLQRAERHSDRDGRGEPESDGGGGVDRVLHQSVGDEGKGERGGDVSGR